MTSFDTRDPDTRRDVVVRALHLMADGRPADFHGLVHPAARNREARSEPPACRGEGPAAFHATARWLWTAFDELRWEVHEAVVEGDLVVLHTTMSGRHTGDFVVHDAQGAVERVFPATGRGFAVTQTHWHRMAGDQVIEHWANRDNQEMARQLGWLPPTPAYLVRAALATRRARRATEVER